MDVGFALFVVIFLQFLDIWFTHRILSLYRRVNPEDEDWADLEFNKNARLIFKKYGLSKTSFAMQIISTSVLMIVFFGMIYIFDFDLTFFVYAAFGALTYVNIHHYAHYEKLKESLQKQLNNEKIKSDVT